MKALIKNKPKVDKNIKIPNISTNKSTKKIVFVLKKKKKIEKVFFKNIFNNKFFNNTKYFLFFKDIKYYNIKLSDNKKKKIILKTLGFNEIIIKQESKKRKLKKFKEFSLKKLNKNSKKFGKKLIILNNNNTKYFTIPNQKKIRKIKNIIRNRVKYKIYKINSKIKWELLILRQKKSLINLAKIIKRQINKPISILIKEKLYKQIKSQIMILKKVSLDKKTIFTKIQRASKVELKDISTNEVKYTFYKSRKPEANYIFKGKIKPISLNKTPYFQKKQKGKKSGILRILTNKRNIFCTLSDSKENVVAKVSSGLLHVKGRKRRAEHITKATGRIIVNHIIEHKIGKLILFNKGNAYKKKKKILLKTISKIKLISETTKKIKIFKKNKAKFYKKKFKNFVKVEFSIVNRPAPRSHNGCRPPKIRRK